MTRHNDCTITSSLQQRVTPPRKSSGHPSKTSMTRRNDHTITSSLQRRVTHPREVKDILRKPVQPAVTVAPQLAA